VHIATERDARPIEGGGKKLGWRLPIIFVGARLKSSDGVHL